MVLSKRRNAAALSFGVLLVVAAVFGVLSPYSNEIEESGPLLKRSLRDSIQRRDEEESIVCLLSHVELLLSADPMESTQNIQCTPILDGEEHIHVYDIELDDESNKTFFARTKEQGAVTVSISNAYINEEEARIVLSSASAVKFLDSDMRKRRRKMLETTGSYSLLVVRVELSNGSPTFSESQLYDYTFQRDVSMKKQYARCSFGKLKISPAPLGVITVRLNNMSTGNSQQSIVNAAQTAAVATINSRYGRSYTTIRDHTDMVIYVLPQMGNWLAYGTVGGGTSVYNDEWAGYVASVMHETGHNFGLLHAHEGSEYHDYTGYMGGAVIGYHDKIGFPAMCYNAANHWHLDWFADRAVAANLFRPTLLRLAAFVDYDKTTSGEHYVLARTGNVYMQYNRAKGINADSYEYKDHLTIYQDVSSGSYLFAALSWKGTRSYKRSFSSGTWHAEICDSISGNGYTTPDHLVISIGFGNSLCSAYYSSPRSALNTYRP